MTDKQNEALLELLSVIANTQRSIDASLKVLAEAVRRAEEND